jgi:hypothetical protein
MFVKAKKILASELMYAKDMDEEEAAEWLDSVLVNSSTNGANGRKKTTAAKPARVAAKTTKPAARKTAKPAARKTAKPAAKSKPTTKARAGSR